MKPTIQVEGLTELRRDLRKIDPALAKELRAEFVDIGKAVAADARSRVPRGPTGRAQASLRSGMSGSTAYVAGGKQSVPYYGWLDFGSRSPRRGNSRRVGPWAGSGRGPKGGRFIYPAIARHGEAIARRAGDAFDRAKRKALGGL